MKTIMELMTTLFTMDSAKIDEAAKTSAECGISGAKEVYMAWGKERGITAKVLEGAWKEAQPAKASGGRAGFADSFYDWLAEASRSEQEAADRIMSNESQNVRNHLTHYLNIWALAESVRAGKRVARTITASKTARPSGASANEKKSEPKDDWEYNDSAPFEDVRSAWENLKREAKKPKPRKTRLHPDKVAKFNDTELSDAYHAAYKTYCA